MPQCKMLTYCFSIANAKCILLGVRIISIWCKTCEYLRIHCAIVEFLHLRMSPCLAIFTPPILTMGKSRG
uniref:Uncharacterized protein n=1 Tax=Arundo donax TaxID=35708 RepID=A0A0A9DKT8_ARUDO